jgi:putative ABC transport system permease protein
MVGSISLIHNSFSISVSERSREFGILSSVGATQKQLAYSVLFEGLIVAFIGIPIGVLCGIAGIGVTLGFVGDIITGQSISDVDIYLFISTPMIVIAIAVALITILISAYIPAIRAAKTSAIDIIRQSSDIKISAKKLRGGSFTGKLFGIEGFLAIKSFKRNRKRYRSTIFSLFISIVIFITAASYGLYLSAGQESMIEIPKYNITYIVPTALSDTVDDFEQIFYEMKAEEHVINAVWVITAGSDFYSPQTIFSQERIENNNRFGIAEGRSENIGQINIAFMQDEAFKKYLGQLGLPEDDFMGLNATRTITISNHRNNNAGGRVIWEDSFADTSRPVDVHLLDWRNILDGVPGYGERYSITLTDFTEQTPDFINLGAFNSNLDIILPASRGPILPYLYDRGLSPYFFFESDDPFATTDYFRDLLVSHGQLISNIERQMINHTALNESNRQFVVIINVFTYGFTILISLIAIANVFNTISTSIRLRRRELAMLKSIGLSDTGFNKMMNYECMFYGIKSLLYGLPVAGLMTYLIYLAVDQGIALPFMLPVPEIIIAITGVFAIVFASMFYSTRRIKNENIIDALKDEVT